MEEGEEQAASGNDRKPRYVYKRRRERHSDHPHQLDESDHTMQNASQKCTEQGNPQKTDENSAPKLKKRKKSHHKTHRKRRRKEQETSSDSSARGLNNTGEPLVVEGRRCGLCGLASDPTEDPALKKAMQDPNSTIGRGGLGRLLGPLSDGRGLGAVWVHQECAVWSPEVYFLGVGCLKSVKAALRRGRFLKCSRCGQPGATIGCRVPDCPRTYHLPCARVSGCSFNHKRYLIACADHVHLFLLQDKQRLRECMIGLCDDQNPKKTSNKERRFDETMAEDEEFAKREKKRLQRDLLRLAPVKIGGGEPIKYEGWESVGGLENVVQCLKEMVTLPLLYPEIFEKLGIVPPRGVLLHGYPGTGKTHVVRALLGACSRGERKISYFYRKGADCLGKYVGDSERQLRLMFQLAQHSQPSIIFFDEIDGLAPKRSRSQEQTHSSVVSTLLALMDGLSPRGQVVVIAATNRPDSLDPALRRPGRFDREIFFPLPSAADRETILKVHTSTWQSSRPSPDILSALSRTTVGYAGADLKAVCSQAALSALKRTILMKGPSDDALTGLTVQASDWAVGLSRAGPPCSRRILGSALSEIQICPMPKYLVPALLRPVVEIFMHLDSEGSTLSLPSRLKKAVAFAKEQKFSDNQPLCSTKEVEDFFRGTGIFLEEDMGFHENERDLQQVFKDVKTGSCRVLLMGARRVGKSLVAYSVLHALQSFMQVFVLSIQTMIQAGSGDLCEGLIHILENARAISSVVFMPRISSWALEKEALEKEACETEKEENITIVSSKAWRTFLQQTSSLPSNHSVLFLATCDEQELTADILDFFTNRSSKAKFSTRARVEVSVPTETQAVEVLKRAAEALASSLITCLKQNDAEVDSLQPSELTTGRADSRLENANRNESSGQERKSSQIGGQESSRLGSVNNIHTSQAQENVKQRSSLQDAIRNCGYQLLNSPNFQLVRQATSRLGSGPNLFLEDPYTGLWVIKNTPKVDSDEKNNEAADGHSGDKGAADGDSGDQAADGDSKAKQDTKEKQEDSLEKEKEVNHTKRWIDALGSDEDSEDVRTVWGINAVGLKACKGFYTTSLEVVNEVKEVVRVVRESMGKKVFRSRSRQWQRVQILTQSSALQDLMDCWSYELRRLESREKKNNVEVSSDPPKETLENLMVGKPTPQVIKRPKRPECVQPADVRVILMDLWNIRGQSLLIEDINDLINEVFRTLFYEAYANEDEFNLNSTGLVASVRNKLGI